MRDGRGGSPGNPPGNPSGPEGGDAVAGRRHAGGPVLEGIAREGLAQFVQRAEEHRNSAEAWHRRDVCDGDLHVDLGLLRRPARSPNTPASWDTRNSAPGAWSGRPRNGRRGRFAPSARVTHESEVEALRTGQGRLAPQGLLVRMLADRALDETMLGNLIYQVEMSRSDMKNLFRWLTRHALDDPEVVDAIAREEPNAVEGHSSLRPLS